MKNGFLMFFILVFLTTFCQAQTGMYVHQNDGNVLVIPITNIDSVTYDANIPLITTVEVNNITTFSAIISGFVNSSGGNPVLSRGVCWSTDPNPTISDSKTTDGSGSGAFTSSITGLSPNTTYYVRSYATNSVGTAYGVEKSFTCLREYLSSLSFKSWGSEIAISPTFVKTTNSYTATVSFYSGMNVTLTPTAENANSTITVNGVSVASGASLPVTLSVGPNSITVTVYYGGVVQQIYEINVFRKPEANLSSLNIMSGSTNISLDPVFEPTHREYVAYVDYNVDAVTVTPASESSTSYIEVATVGVASGAASDPIPLNVGANEIYIHVDDYGDGNDYAIKIIRRVSPSLNSLNVMSGLTNIALSPSFSPTTYNYTAFADYDMGNVTITPTGKATSTFFVNGNLATNGMPSSPINLAIGTNYINVKVDDNGESTVNYNLAVTRHTSSYITSFFMKSGKTTVGLDTPFSRSTLSYTGHTSLSPLNLTFYLEDPAATVKVNANGVDVASTATTASVPLSTGNNNLVITVTSSTGQRKSYTFDILKSL